MTSPSERMVLVTVGTTKFDELIRQVDSVKFADALKAKGYSKLVIQKGAGDYLPRFFEFVPSLADMLGSAALVISHAGSGSIFEALSLRKPLIVVPNPLLMDNHQAELAHHLEAHNYLVACPPAQLLDGLRRLYSGQLQPYPKNNGCDIVTHIDVLMGLRQPAA